MNLAEQHKSRPNVVPIKRSDLRMRLQELAGSPVAVYPAFRKTLGLNASAAQFLSQALYWFERTQDGWFYKTNAEWFEETGLTVTEVEGARKKMAALGILSEKRKGVPQKLYYRLDVDRLTAMLSGAIAIPEPVNTGRSIPRKPRNQFPENMGIESHKTSELIPRKHGNYCPENMGTITKNTQEITTEITADTFAVTDADAPELPAVVSASDAIEGELVPAITPAKPRCELPSDMPGPKDSSCKTYRAWANYAVAYRNRYGVWPVWNAKSAGQISKLVDRLGANDAPKVAAFYLCTNDARVISDCHSLNGLLARAEGLHTQWLTGRHVTQTTARQMERRQANITAGQAAAQSILERSQRGEGSPRDKNPFL